MKVGIIGYGLMGKRRRNVLPAEDIVVTADVGDPIGPACDCDATIISVPTPNLHEVCLNALSKGARRILLEKPCATTSAECREIAVRAEEVGAIVVPAYTLRHYPAVMVLIAHVESMPDPLCASMFYGHGGGAAGWRARPNGGGELLDQGSHLLDLCIAIGLAGPVRSAALDRVNTADVEDLIAVRMGRTEIGASWCMWPNVFGVSIVLPNHLLRVSGLGKAYGGVHEFQIIAREDGKMIERHEHSPHIVRERALVNEWTALLQEDDNSRLQDAVRVLELIEEARRCAS